jgi:fibronectin type 3 domain-containing protein
MNKAPFRFGLILITSFSISVSFICGLIIFSGCAAIDQTDIPVFHHPKVAAKNKYSSGNSGTGQVTLTWINVLHANCYNIYISKIPEAKNNGKKISFVDANPVTITDLELGITYYFVVTAINNILESDASNEVVHILKE